MGLQIRSEDYYACYKYRLRDIYLKIDNVVKRLGAHNILELYHMNEYDNNIRTLLTLTLSLDIGMQIWVRENWGKFQVYIELDKFRVSPNNEAISASEPALKGLFNVYDDNRNSSYNTANYKLRAAVQREDPNGINNFSEQNNQVDVFHLYNLDQYTKSNQSCGFVLTKCNLQSAVSMCLSKIHKTADVLISPFQNATQYEELIIPPIPLYKAISYLDNKYGFYIAGSVIFYDINNLYILNAGPGCTAWRDKEYKRSVLYVYSTAGDDGQLDAMIIRKEDPTHYFTAMEANTSFQNMTQQSTTNFGSEITQINVDTGESQNAESTNGSSTTITKNKQFTYGTDNKYTSSNLEARLNELKTIVSFSGANWDIEAFTPNKEFGVIFADDNKNKMFSNSYRISSATHHFIPNGDGVYTLTTVGQLKLTKGISDSTLATPAV
jgi:hypothetical protein